MTRDLGALFLELGTETKYIHTQTHTHTHTHTHYIVNKDLLYGTGNYTQYFVIPHKVNESGKKKKKEEGVMLTSLFECVSKERHQECLLFFIKKKKNDAKFPFNSG